MSDQNPHLERLHELTSDVPNSNQDQMGYTVPDPQLPFSGEGYRPAQPEAPQAPEAE